MIAANVLNAIAATSVPLVTNGSRRSRMSESNGTSSRKAVLADPVAPRRVLRAARVVVVTAAGSRLSESGHHAGIVQRAGTGRRVTIVVGTVVVVVDAAATIAMIVTTVIFLVRIARYPICLLHSTGTSLINIFSRRT